MTVHNSEIAEIFERYATLLEIQGANAFRVRAYRNAARSVEDLPHSVAGMVADGADLSELPDVGADLAGKIETIVDTGRLPELDALEKDMPSHLADIAAIPGLGPKRVEKLHKALKIDNLADLKKAAEAGKVRELEGFGAKTEAHILTEIGRHEVTEKRFKLIAAEEMGDPLLAHLKTADGVKDAVIAGSYRRRKETVGDLDILVTCKKSSPVMDLFVGYEDVAEVVSKGTTRSTVRLRSGLQVDLRVVPQVSYGAALHYFTGSKAHNIATRKMAIDRDWKLNEYGLFKGDDRIAGRTEAEIYKTLGLAYVEPELREDRGEIEAARKNRLPELITLGDIRGDLHMHTKATDGHYTIREMAEAAKDRGYAYIAVSDHSQHVAVARGLDERRLAEQIAEIDKINESLDGIRVLKSAEVDILEDGSLDLPDSVLKELDLTTCSIHYKFDLPEAKQTERIIRAMDNPYFTILGHPTGRKLGEREPYAVDMERLLAAAKTRGCSLEINAQPERLDLNDVHAKMAAETGVKLAICTDAHTTAMLDYMRFGVGQARRGWLTAGDVLNTREWRDLKTLLKRN